MGLAPGRGNGVRALAEAVEAHARHGLRHPGVLQPRTNLGNILRLALDQNGLQPCVRIDVCAHKTHSTHGRVGGQEEHYSAECATQASINTCEMVLVGDLQEHAAHA